MRAVWTRIGAAGALLCCASAAAAVRLAGDAYSLNDNALLYHETQYVYAGGAARVVLYSCPDGRAFARKRIRSSGDAQTPDFDLVDAHLGYREGVHDRGSEREVYVQRRADRPLQSEVVRVPADAVIDTGFDAFAQRNWDALASGQTLRFRYLVPSRRTFYGFKVRRVDDGRGHGQRMTVRISLGFWLSFLLPHIDIVYDRALRRVVHYEGLSNIRGDDGRNYRVRADYPVVAEREVAHAEVVAALDAPLVSSCTAADERVSADGHPTVPEVTIAARERNPNP
jgi:hypothetical protein